MLVASTSFPVLTGLLMGGSGLPRDRPGVVAAHAPGDDASVSSAASAQSGVRDRRLRATRVVAAAAAFGWGFFFFGLIDLLVVVIQDEAFFDAYLLETGWGLLYTVLVAVPLVALAVRPRSPVLLRQLLAVSAAVAVTAVVTPAWPQLVPGAGLLATVIVLARLSRQRAWSPRDWSLRHAGPVSGALVLVAVIGAVGYAASMIQAARVGYPDDVTWGLDHLPMQAAFGVALAASVGLGAASREPGWRVCAWSAAVSAIWLGAVSVAYPEHLGRLGRPLGFAAIAWGLLFAAATQLWAPRRRRA